MGCGVIVVGGIGRSGTTVIKRCIAAHSRVGSLPFQTRFLADPGGLADFLGTIDGQWSPFIADRALEELSDLLGRLGQGARWPARLAGRLIRRLDPLGEWLSAPRYFGWGLERVLPSWSERVSILMTCLDDISYQGTWAGDRARLAPQITVANPAQVEKNVRYFAEGVFGELAKRAGSDLWAESSTWAPLMAPLIQRILPASRMVVVGRDLRDVAASMMAQRWSPREPREVVRFVKMLRARLELSLERADSSRICYVDLERLAEDAEGVMVSLCSFLTLSYEPAMLEPIEADRFNVGRWLELDPMVKGMIEASFQGEERLIL